MALKSPAPPKPADPGLAAYAESLQGAALEPLWERMGALAPHEPQPKALPFLWPYAQVRPRLIEAGDLISAEAAERRVLVLANPGLPGRSQATDTLYAGLQLLLPGETAPTHRHSQTAIRFVVEGKGAYTAVDGQSVSMSPGDFIVTPAFSWHEHGHPGEDKGPVVWLDGLDVPLVGFLGAGFREEPGPRDKVDPPALRTFHCPYAHALEALEAIRVAGQPDPWRGWRLDYADAAAGGLTMRSLAASLTLLPKGFEGRACRSTDSAVILAVEGEVGVEVGAQAFRLQPKDVLAVPGWTPWRLRSGAGGTLFTLSDRPAHEALGLWREARK